MTEKPNVTLPGKVEKIIKSPDPSEPEKAKLLQLLKDSKESEIRPVVEDIYWAILSSREFLFNH